MATKANAQKDREMASRLKAEKVKRTGGRCPICNRVISPLEALQNHIQFHK